MTDYDEDQYADGDEPTQIRESLRTKDDPHGLIGHTLDERYHIQKVIGVGGMGVVYKGRQEAMDRTVAVKVLMPQMIDDESLIKRFHLEARAASRLTHPNTITVYDFGRSGDLLYIVMEFLEGASLEKVLKEQKILNSERVARIASQALASLAEAHEKEIIHRDIKPDNIWLKEVGDQKDFVKVLDFGVAKLRDPKVTDTTMTQAGMIFGTPKYMSPEQAKAKKLDGRSDLYSLGVVMYQALIGRCPFTATDPVSILIQHVHDPPPPFQEILPGYEVPRPLEEIVFRSLEKDRNNRFADAKEMRQAVEAFLAGAVSQSFTGLPAMTPSSQSAAPYQPAPNTGATLSEQPSPTPSAGYGGYPYGSPPTGTPQPQTTGSIGAPGTSPSGPQMGLPYDPSGQSVWNMGAAGMRPQAGGATEWVQVQPQRHNTALLASVILLGLLLLAGIGYLIFRIQIPPNSSPGSGELVAGDPDAAGQSSQEDPSVVALVEIPDAGLSPVATLDADTEVVAVVPEEVDAAGQPLADVGGLALPVPDMQEAEETTQVAIAADVMEGEHPFTRPVRVRFQFERPDEGISLAFGERRFERDPAAQNVWIFDRADGDRLLFEASADRHRSAEFDEDISQVEEGGELLVTIRLRRIRSESSTRDPCVDPVTGLRDPYCRP
ncbi:MAG: protein kinase [Bradymonadales bacterium]|nr:protein kinase [Bradymonadales bacterium]